MQSGGGLRAALNAPTANVVAGHKPRTFNVAILNTAYKGRWR